MEPDVPDERQLRVESRTTPERTASGIAWRFYNAREDIERSRRRLPHWEQPGVCYFLTFRTADSVPVEVAKDFRYRRRTWLIAHGIDPDLEGWHQELGELPDDDQRTFHRDFSREYHALLVKGYGECLLKQPAIASTVVDALRHFDGDRYDLGDFVIMPNHLHLLVQFIGDGRLKKQCYSWKHFTAREINRCLGRTGHVWQGETYDHIVRSEFEFDNYRKYIADNPVKAGLKDGFVLSQQG